MAWFNKSNYDKAIGYFELALAIYENGLGENHPSTVFVRVNLTAAKRR